MSNTYLKYINVDLSKSYLVGAWFYEIEFRKSNLTNNNFSNISIWDVCFIDCDLSRSNFRNANFLNCKFDNTRLNNIIIDDKNAE